MTFFGVPILSFMIFAPLAGAFLLLFFPRTSETAQRIFSLLVSVVVFAAGVVLFLRFEPNASFQFEENLLWISKFNVHYHLAVDGISLLLIILTALLLPVVILAGWRSISTHVRAYHVAFLVLEAAVIGAFSALDLFLFYIFWELLLIPMYLIIGVWGGKRRIYAAVKFFLFTAVGSFLMFFAILYLVVQHHAATGILTFQLADYVNGDLPTGAAMLCFLAFALAFGIKVPLVPVHTWLPDAHVEAPAGGSIILAGVLLKLGSYGFIRFAIPLFPRAYTASLPWLVVLAVVGITYGAWVSFAQKDVKKLVAYSSVAHLGFVMLGLFAMTSLGVTGSVIQMVNHGLSTGALFLMVGFIYDRTHTRMMEDYGGLAAVMPVFFALFLLVTLSSVGLPGLNGFIGEFLVLAGAFPVFKTATIIATSGVIFAAVYLLYLVRKVFFGAVNTATLEGLQDLSIREIICVLILGIFIVWIGVYPSTFLSRIEPAVQEFLKNYQLWVAP
ncbi:MAG TPA: NADH-quinone oxidoreductase subunit M [Thermoanaerobaculia bacterium]|nr:NADH-quinone oxidoreductase subunit M [Thermoanaerobaculia bacterium]HUM29518.1 NADH-quinone oxidoreductase subunit M [Thermoanaerobaculia bacterium]HXK67901.1 NADH-quinone oxidoreductase subunit M [Thermoanaerobaculia bacterium]